MRLRNAAVAASEAGAHPPQGTTESTTRLRHTELMKLPSIMMLRVAYGCATGTGANRRCFRQQR